jgi:hypothetical protein
MSGDSNGYHNMKVFGGVNVFDSFGSYQIGLPIQIAVQGREQPITLTGIVLHEMQVSPGLDGHSHYNGDGYHNNLTNQSYPVTHYCPHGSIKPQVTEKYKGKDRNGHTPKGKPFRGPVEMKKVTRMGSFMQTVEYRRPPKNKI